MSVFAILLVCGIAVLGLLALAGLVVILIRSREGEV
jgi:hypothetical protein